MKVIGSGTTGTCALGVIVGVIGLIGICANYPLYRRILMAIVKEWLRRGCADPIEQIISVMQKCVMPHEKMP